MTGPKRKTCMSSSAPHKPSALGRAANHIRFVLERLVLRGLPYRLLVAASLVAIAALLGGAIIRLFDSSFANLGEAVWWAFLRLSDAGHLGFDEGVARRIVSTSVTVLGFVLFIGLFIAILTHWLEDTISRLESGITPVSVSDHVVILGWTPCTPVIVVELLRASNRVDRLSTRHGAGDLRIVILAPHVDEHLVRELRAQLGELWNDKQVLLRSGTPLQVDHLERVAFRDAAVLVLPSSDHAERNSEAVDAQTVKTLRTVAASATDSGFTPPLAVAEIYDSRKAAVARRAYGGPTEIIATNSLISRFIAQSVRQRGLLDVLSDLLSLNEGNSLFVREAGDLAGTPFDSLRSAYPQAIPIGTVRSGASRPYLNPDPETILENEDLLVFVARHFDHCVPRAVQRDGAPTATTPASHPVLERRRLLILGWSRKVPALLDELERYGTNVFEVDVVSPTPLEEREISEHGYLGTPNSRVRQIEASFAVPGVLERLEPQRYDNVVLLASERFANEGQADASTVFTYLMLREILPEAATRPELLVELLSEENEFLIDQGLEDVIVSPLLVSYVLSQVALRPELAAVIGELSQPWGAQIVLQPAENYEATQMPVRFQDLERAAASRGEIALGLRRSRDSDAGVVLNPERQTEWSLEPGDEVVVLATYPEVTGEA